MQTSVNPKELKCQYRWVTNIVYPVAAVAVYSLSGFFTKLASRYDFLTLPYDACLVGALIVLGIYAVLWQIILKLMPLSVAYPFRSLGVVYGLAIAGFAFSEPITWQNLIGGAIVMFGLFVLTKK